MIRRLVFALNAILLQEYAWAQVQIVVMHCIIVIMFIQMTKPFEVPLLNLMEVINECFIIGAAYHLFIFTDFVPDPII